MIDRQLPLQNKLSKNKVINYKKGKYVSFTTTVPLL